MPNAMSWLFEHDTFRHAFLASYVLVLIVVCVYGTHRYVLVHLYRKYRHNVPRLRACFVDLPRVTIQLPMYNEKAVARRLIDATCEVDYPRDRLEIQVLDDSTDGTTEVAREAVAHWQSQGVDIHLIHRTDRTGYKAGALAEGTKVARGQFILLFDADFIPPPDILRETIHHFTDSRVGMVQARWEHLNRDHSLLTRAQAVLLDGHFMIEHGARNRSGRFMSFNGTAGIWRKACIEDAGGWQHDTLTEDLDLSYRAQMKGWKFLFLPRLTSAAELPPDMEAFKQQQYRWAKGGAQTARKLLPKVFKSRLPKRIKIEAFYHLTSCLIYPFIVLLTLMLYPVIYLKLHLLPNEWERYLLDASIILIATCSAATFYVASQRALLRSWADSIKYIPFLMAIGVGISLNNARAVFSGLFGRPSEFVRTPKFGAVARGGIRRSDVKRARMSIRRIRIQPWFEFAIGCYLLSCLLMCLAAKNITFAMPFLCLFMIGYFYVPLNGWFGHLLSGRATEAAAPMPLPVSELHPSRSADAANMAGAEGLSAASGVNASTTTDVVRLDKSPASAGVDV